MTLVQRVRLEFAARAGATRFVADGGGWAKQLAGSGSITDAAGILMAPPELRRLIGRESSRQMAHQRCREPGDGCGGCDGGGLASSPAVGGGLESWRAGASVPPFYLGLCCRF